MLNFRRLNRASTPVEPTPAVLRLGVVDWWGRFPVLERRRTDFGLWWGNRTPRERRLLVVLASAAAIALVIMGIYRPLSGARSRAVAEIHTYEVLAAQLRMAGPEIARLRALDRRAAPAAVTSSASAFGLPISRLEERGGMLHLSLEDADFTKLIQWLVQLETTTTLRTHEVKIERRPTPGLVNAQIGLKG